MGRLISTLNHIRDMMKKTEHVAIGTSSTHSPYMEEFYKKYELKLFNALARYDILVIVSQ